MKSLACFWVISLFSCCLSDENVVFKCGSPTCDVKISDARAHITYHSDGVHLKRGHAVSIYGKSDQNYYIKQGDNFGFIPRTFVTEQSVDIASQSLVNASEEFISKFLKKNLGAPPATPPLGNESLTENAVEDNKVENLEEIASSKPYEVVDGTTLYLDGQDFASQDLKVSNNDSAETSTDSVLASPDAPIVEVKSEAEEKAEVAGSEVKVESEAVEKVESAVEEKVEVESEADEKVKVEFEAEKTVKVESEAEEKVNVEAEAEGKVQGESEEKAKVEAEAGGEADLPGSAEKGSEPEKQLDPAADSANQVESEEEDGEEEEEETEDEIDAEDVSTAESVGKSEVESEVDKNEVEPEFESKVQSVVKAFGALFGDSEDVTEAPTGTQSASEETPSLEGEPVVNNVDDIQTPSTADLLSGGVQNTQFYEPTPTLFPSKTEEKVVEATAQPALSENAESAKSVESLIAPTEEELYLEKAEVSAEEIATANDSPTAGGEDTPNVDTNEKLNDSVESSTMANDSVAVGEDTSNVDTNKELSDLTESSTVQPSLKEEVYESGAVADFQEQTAPVDGPFNASSADKIVPSESPVQEDSGFLPTTSPQEYEAAATDTPLKEFDSEENAEEEKKVTPEIVEPETTPVETESPMSVADESEAVNVAHEAVTAENESSGATAPDSGADQNDALTLPVAEEQVPSSVPEEAGTYPTTEESLKVNETDFTTPSPEEPVKGIYDSLISPKQMYDASSEYAGSTITSDPEPVSAEAEKIDSLSNEPAESSKEPASSEKAYPSTVEEPVSISPNLEVISEEEESPGIFGKVLEVGYDSILSLKESSFFGFWSGKTEDNIESVWHNEKLGSPHLSLDDTCKIEDRNCPSLKQEEKLVAPTVDSALAMEYPEQSSSEIMFSSLLDPLLSSTCMKAQSLLIFLTTAVVLVFSASCYFYLDKRSKDASFFKRIDLLEKQLFISKKEALEYENKFNSLSSNLGNTDVDSSSVVMNSAHVTELEAQRNELSEKVELLSNELSVTIGMNKDLERRLQEVRASTQDTEMIFKTVDQLQRAVEMQQKSSSELKAQIKNKDKVIEGLEESLQKSVADASNLVELVAALKKENEKLSVESSEKIIHLASELDQVKSEKTLESTRLRGEIDSLKLSLEQARSSLEVAEASIIELKAIISEDAKSLDNLGDVFNGSELKAKLAVAELNIEKLKDRLQEETGARQFLEEHVTSVTEALNQLKASYNDLEKEKQEAENAVKVLKDYFKKQEEELKKEIEEKSAFQLQKDEETLMIQLKTLKEEESVLKNQIKDLKKEIVEQENLFKRKQVELEKKAEDNWLESRQIKRKLDDSKQEAALLRSRLTTVEKLLSEKNDNPDNDQSMTNGEGMQQPSVSSPSMLLNFPNTATSSFAKYNSSDLNFPPPLSLPGGEFIPPPPIYHPDLRLPPLGSVARIPSPPRGMSPPLSLETNFGLNFSPPPPMPPPQYYYYHRSDSPSDYDSSYSKGERYRDSPSNLESSGSSKHKAESSRKVPEQPDAYPPSNPSHPPPLKPVARNPTSAGQKGWTSSGQPNKPVEKNSRKTGR